MAKVTITIEDKELDGRSGADILTEFDPPLTADQQEALSHGEFDKLTAAQVEGIAFITAQQMSGAELTETRSAPSDVPSAI